MKKSLNHCIIGNRNDRIKWLGGFCQRGDFTLYGLANELVGHEKKNKAGSRFEELFGYESPFSYKRTIARAQIIGSSRGMPDFSAFDDVGKIVELAPRLFVLAVQQAIELGNERFAATQLAVKIGIALYGGIYVKHFQMLSFFKVSKSHNKNCVVDQKYLVKKHPHTHSKKACRIFYKFYNTFLIRFLSLSDKSCVLSINGWLQNSFNIYLGNIAKRQSFKHTQFTSSNHMNELFKTVTEISHPLGIIGLISTIFFLIVRQLIKNNVFVQMTSASTKHVYIVIINRIFILTITAMVLGFTLSAIDTFSKTKVVDAPKMLTVNGSVWLEGHKLDNVKVNVLEAGEDFTTNSSGKFNIPIADNAYSRLTLTFLHPDIEQETVTLTDMNALRNIVVNLKRKKSPEKPEEQIPDGIIPKPEKIILSGRVTDPSGNALSNVRVAAFDGKITASTNTNGEFALKSKKEFNAGQMVFSFSKQGYATQDEIYYVHSKNNVIELHEKN